MILPLLFPGKLVSSKLWISKIGIDSWTWSAFLKTDKTFFPRLMSTAKHHHQLKVGCPESIADNGNGKVTQVKSEKKFPLFAAITEKRLLPSRHIFKTKTLWDWKNRQFDLIPCLPLVQPDTKQSGAGRMDIFTRFFSLSQRLKTHHNNFRRARYRSNDIPSKKKEWSIKT